MVTGSCNSIEDLLVNLQRRQEANAEANRKAFVALHDIVDKLGSTVVDLSSQTVSSNRGEASSSAWNREGSQYTKILQTTMSTFDWKNVEGWIYKVKRYFRYHHVPDDERLVQATMSMEGEALDWLVWMDVRITYICGKSF